MISTVMANKDSIPIGAVKRRRWRETLMLKKENRTWWLVKIDFKNDPETYRWLCSTAAEHNVSVAKLVRIIIQDAMGDEECLK